LTATLPTGTADVVVDKLFPTPDPYTDDPALWVSEVLGEHLWSKQVEIVESVVANRHTAVPSCHGTGKSFIASRLAAWWLDAHPAGEAFVVTTAPSDKQVKAILWREIGKAIRAAKRMTRRAKSFILNSRTTLDAQWYVKLGDQDELVAYGRKPQDLQNEEEAATAFQGIHAKYVLVILDEACGIPKWLWDAVDSLVTNEHSRVLAIGNPTDPTSHFEKVCRPGSGWNVIPIGYQDTPNFTGEAVPDKLRDLLLGKTWVAERLARWGRKSSLYISKVLGFFPESADDTLISAQMIKDAQARDLSGRAISDPGNYGWDIGELGPDETAGYLNRGGMVRRMYANAAHNPMEAAGDIAAVARDHRDRSHQVDKIGVGSGTYFRLLELGIRVSGFGAGEKARDPLRFKNRRAEAWWTFRQMMIDGAVDLDPGDEELAAELQAPKWGRDSAGRVWLESKEKMRDRGIASPNRADAVIMSFVRSQGGDVLTDQPLDAKSHAGPITKDLLNRPM